MGDRSLIGKIDILIDASIYENTFEADLNINKSDLDTEFCNQSRKYAYYGGLSKLAADREDRVENELKVLEAQLDHQIREEAAAVKADSPKFKMTEAMVAHQIKADDRYQKKFSEYLTAKKLAGMMLVAERSFQMRKDMLVSLGANARALNSEPRITGVQQETSRQAFLDSSDPDPIRRRDPKR